LEAFPKAQAQVKDLAEPLKETFDAVCCFFLLHEVPSETRKRIVSNLLNSVPVGGKVVFVDYHQPKMWHPMGPVMALVFHYLEPYAFSLLNEDIATLVPECERFSWSPKQTMFGSLYQKLVATRVS
jgi:SAM-dependent methyltransferase